MSANDAHRIGRRATIDGRSIMREPQRDEYLTLGLPRPMHTNILKANKSAVDAAIALTGLPILWSDEATPAITGEMRVNFGSIQCAKHIDLSQFWNEYRRLTGEG